METPSPAVRRKTIGPKELAAVTALPGPKRFAHFVSQVADWQEIWGLRSPDGWVSAAGDAGATAFPVWPHEVYAARCTSGSWLGAVPVAIKVHEFLATFVPNMKRDGTQVAVFPTPSGAVVIVSATELEAALQAELARVE